MIVMFTRKLCGICQFALLISLIFTARCQYTQECSALDKFKDESNLKKHSFTNRDIGQLYSYMPPFVVDHWRYLSARDEEQHLKNSSMKLLEIGCGGGKTSLEMRELLPHADIICLNKAGYGYVQATSTDDILKAAAYYSYNLKCSPNESHFHLPHLMLVKYGVQEQPLPLADKSVDIIYSQHALNVGKLQSHESAMLPPRILRLLKKGGYASLLLLPMEDNLFLPSFEPDSYFTMVKGRTIFYRTQFTPLYMCNWNLKEESGSATMMLYIRQQSLGLVIRRCLDSTINTTSLGTSRWGCILPRDRISTDIDKSDSDKDRAKNGQLYFNKTLSDLFLARAMFPLPAQRSGDGVKTYYFNSSKPENNLNREYCIRYIHHLMHSVSKYYMPTLLS